ncbi:MAG: putative DNA binding domain-containing protein [Thaumarchaeota archaeon]|nr:putative DNA binding domain-containing protein [Nitrososphaerota archaeon]
MSEIIGKMLQEHYKLFEGASQKVGELHYLILKSQEIVENLKRNDKSFEGEIGRDEIHWWIFYKEKDLKELKNRTGEVLEAFQRVKEDSVKLRQSLQPRSYSELIDGMKKFCIDHESEIQALLDYVKWLATKDPRSVIMLFNYRVWGSTRMGDRTIPVSKKNEKATVNACVEISLGLRRSAHGPMISRAFNDVSYEIFESMQSEDYSTPIEIPWDGVVTRASNEILMDMAEYFEFLRNALRNILLEIEEYETSDSILHDNGFWKSFVGKVIELPIENMVWDFKVTLAMWEAKGTMKKKKEVEFCEDIASLANMQGGVLIIGISDKMPRKVVGLEDLENKMKYTKDVIQKGITYPRDLTHFQVLALENESGEKKLCLLVVVKQAMEVVGVKNEKPIEDSDMKGMLILPTYPIRNETGITRISYSDVSNAKIHLKHDSYRFLTSLETNYGKKS